MCGEHVLAKLLPRSHGEIQPLHHVHHLLPGTPEAWRGTMVVRQAAMKVQGVHGGGRAIQDAREAQQLALEIINQSQWAARLHPQQGRPCGALQEVFQVPTAVERSLLLLLFFFFFYYCFLFDGDGGVDGGGVRGLSRLLLGT